MEKYLSLSEAKAKLNSLVDDIVEKDDEFILTRNGKPVAILISVDFYAGRKETEWIKSHPEFYREIKRGIARLKKGGKRYTFEDVFGEPLK